MSEASAAGADEGVRLLDDGITLEDVLDVLPDAVSLWDTDLRNVYANRAAYALWFGLTPEKLRGMHSSDLLGADLYALNEPHQRACLAGASQVFERDITGVDGVLRRARIEYYPYWQGGAVVGLITVIIDISDRVRAEKAAAQAVERMAVLAERGRISERAHEVGLQALFAALLKLDLLRRKIGPDRELQDAVSAVISCVDAAVIDLRQVTDPQ